MDVKGNRTDNEAERIRGKRRDTEREKRMRGAGGVHERERLLKLEWGCISPLPSLCTFAQAAFLKEVIEEWLRPIASRRDLL